MLLPSQILLPRDDFARTVDAALSGLVNIPLVRTTKPAPLILDLSCFRSDNPAACANHLLLFTERAPSDRPFLRKDIEVAAIAAQWVYCETDVITFVCGC